MGPYCNFCEKRCFCHFPQDTPHYILKAYGTSTIVASCPKGQALEKQEVGFCLDDIKAIAPEDWLYDCHTPLFCDICGSPEGECTCDEDWQTRGLPQTTGPRVVRPGAEYGIGEEV